MGTVDYKKRFVDGIHVLSCGSKSSYEVWQDCITLFAIEIQNTCTRPLKDTSQFKKMWEERETEYIRIANKYSKKERTLFSELFSYLVLEYEREPFQDLLGNIFMMSNMHSKNRGQFFTPYDLCKLMAHVTMDRKAIGKQVHKVGFVNICDSACGAGATLIASVEECARTVFKKYNYQNHVYCVGQDVDRTCALMCYIQLSFLPIAGYVINANTLSEPVVTDLRRIWFTPLWFSEMWAQRRFFGGYDLLMNRRKEQMKL